MIPTFPKFKKIEISDRADIECITRKFPPYSDFNFTSLWSYDIKEEVRISQLNKNLVVRFNDYITGEPFYSFLGDTKVNDALYHLLELSIREGLPPTLKLVPEISVKKCDSARFNIQEDRSHFDYIISVERLMPHDGNNRRLSSRRRLIKKFKESNDFQVTTINIQDKNIQKQIDSVFVKWESQVNQDKEITKHLHSTIERFFKMDNFQDIIAFGVYINSKLVGYSINGYHNGYAVGHFQQGNKDVFSGIYALLMHETAPLLAKLGVIYVNLEQDLDIPGLRSWKMSHKPSTFLKKYIITPIKQF